MQRHWLTRPQTIRKLWRFFIAVLAAVVLAELLVPHKTRFALEGIFGFYALFGFLACAVLIVFAKAVGVFLKRPDTYYDDSKDDA